MYDIRCYVCGKFLSTKNNDYHYEIYIDLWNGIYETHAHKKCNDKWINEWKELIKSNGYEQK